MLDVLLILFFIARSWDNVLPTACSILYFPEPFPAHKKAHFLCLFVCRLSTKVPTPINLLSLSLVQLSASSCCTPPPSLGKIENRERGIQTRQGHPGNVCWIMEEIYMRTPQVLSVGTIPGLGWRNAAVNYACATSKAPGSRFLVVFLAVFCGGEQQLRASGMMIVTRLIVKHRQSVQAMTVNGMNGET